MSRGIVSGSSLAVGRSAARVLGKGKAVFRCLWEGQLTVNGLTKVVYRRYGSIPSILSSTYDGGDSEVSRVHLLGEPLDLAASVTEDDGLRDGESLVQITQRVQLPLFALNLE